MRYILGILIGIGLIVLLFVIVIKGFSSSSTPTNQINLSTYASTNAVSTLYIDGPIVADQDHRTIKISVSQTQAEIDITQGYAGNVINTQSFPNNQSSYAVFLQALKNLNFAKGNTDASKADERGYCALGDRYIYQFSNNGSNLFRFWSTSCGQGTFGGNRQDVRILFEDQIPTSVFNQLTGSIPLG